MKRLLWLLPLLVAVGAAIGVVLYSGAHSWSGERTNWALAVVFGIPVALDLVSRRRRRTISRRKRGGKRHEMPT